MNIYKHIFIRLGKVTKSGKFFIIFKESLIHLQHHSHKIWYSSKSINCEKDFHESPIFPVFMNVISFHPFWYPPFIPFGNIRTYFWEIRSPFHDKDLHVLGGRSIDVSDYCVIFGGDVLIAIVRQCDKRIAKGD